MVELFLTRVKNNNQIIQISNLLQLVICNIFSSSGNVHVHVLTHPEGQNEDKNEESLRKNKKKITEIWGKMRKVELFPNGNCEAG